jgi:PST family polysaccharide transporter
MARIYFDDSKGTQDLSRRSLRSGAVSMSAQGVNLVLQIVSTIVLARLLLPEDFGLVAMVVAVTGFASVFVDLGTRDAVSQRGSLTEGEASALFWITLGVGLAFTCATILGSSLIARFYGEPRLEDVAIALSLTFVIPALYFQQYALMRRALMFEKLAIIDITGNVLATAIAIALAYGGYGYWALVWKTILTAAFVCAGVWLSCGWLPKAPTFSVGVRDLLKFGLNITGYTMTDYVARSADRVALGFTSGAREIGYYQNAFVVYDQPLSLFTLPLHSVAISTLSKLRDNLVELKRSWHIALSSLTFFAAPAFAVLAVTGQDIVVVLLGEKWRQAGIILSVLALRGPAHVVERTLGWLHVAAGRPDRWRHWGVLSCGVQLVALFCGLPFGPIGVAASYVVFMYLLFVPAIVYAGRPLGIGVADVLRAVTPQVVGALFAAGVGFLLRFTYLADASELARIFLLAVVCGVVYLTVTVGIFRVTKPLELAASLTGRFRARRGQPL